MITDPMDSRLFDERYWDDKAAQLLIMFPEIWKGIRNDGTSNWKAHINYYLYYKHHWENAEVTAAVDAIRERLQVDLTCTKESYLIHKAVWRM